MFHNCFTEMRKPPLYVYSGSANIADNLKYFRRENELHIYCLNFMQIKIKH